ncbi:hypothetical protein [Legionella gresilensis]|uniref:YopJ family acetyltransferase n=1 Tax=Legionella gresilensis TaxID=91823 RepID=UPI001040E1AD|nr:hypothetical protein [Legionella gresilensis]
MTYTYDNTNREISRSPDYTFISAFILTKLNETSQGDLRESQKSSNNAYALSAQELKLLFLKKNNDCHVITGTFEQLVSQIVTLLKNSTEQMPGRIQVAYKRTDIDLETGEEYQHWSGMDVSVTTDKIGILYLDSAGDPSNIDIAIEIAHSLENAELTICDDFSLKYKPSAMQKDGESCSIFIADLILQMKKINDLHERIALHRIFNEKENYYDLDPRKLPPILFRNAQSIIFLAQCIDENEECATYRVSNKGELLMEYVARHTIFCPLVNKDVNAAIQAKQIAFARKVRT